MVTPTTLAPDILKKAQYWATADVFDAKTRDEMSGLLEKNDVKELTERFYRDLEFGTGGLRGILGAGTSRMNIYNIRKASAALALELKQVFKEGDLRVAISYDSRLFSKEFARATAEVMAGYNIKALITKELRPVPMLSYLVRQRKCVGGVCVTASHNPPNYNGYKVYWNTGGQITPPHDKAVIARYYGIDDYADIAFVPYETAKAKGLIEEIGEELDRAYFEELKKLSLQTAGKDDFKIVFTPLHGTSGKIVPEGLRLFGFKNISVVPEQEKPDGHFPTVKFPNPEDPEALKMAVDLGKKLNADLVLGTDPDCDRIGIVLNDKGSFKYLNGNQIGSLLVEYVLSGMKERKRLPQNPMVIKTIVTTDQQKDIGEHYGCYVDETLTGFKWICQLIDDYETGKVKPYREYVCGGEESYGFLAGSFVRDKDGISACCLAAEMTAYYKSKGLSLFQVLDQLYRRHGVYFEILHTVTLPGKDGAEKIQGIMKRLRQSPPTSIDSVGVAMLRDFQTKEELSYSDGGFKKSGVLTLPASDVLQFVLKDGTKISARPSGTEPKIKYYVSVKEPVKGNVSDADLQALKAKCQARAERIKDVFVKLSGS